MYRLTLLLLLWTSASLVAHGQSFLYLKKLGGKREIKFYVGEEIRFQLHGDTYFVKGPIEGFGEKHLIIHGTEVYLSDIKRFDIRDKRTSGFNYRASYNVMMVAGIALPLIDVGNQLITENQSSVSLHSSIIATSAALIVGSFILRLLVPKYFVLGEKRGR